MKRIFMVALMVALVVAMLVAYAMPALAFVTPEPGTGTPTGASGPSTNPSAFVSFTACPTNRAPEINTYKATGEGPAHPGVDPQSPQVPDTFNQDPVPATAC